MSNASKPTKSEGVVNRIPLILAVLAALIGLGLEFTLLRGYASHWWNRIPAFYLLWGALSALVLLGAATIASKVLVGKEETHG